MDHDQRVGWLGEATAAGQEQELEGGLILSVAPGSRAETGSESQRQNRQPAIMIVPERKSMISGYEPLERSFSGDQVQAVGRRVGTTTWRGRRGGLSVRPTPSARSGYLA